MTHDRRTFLRNAVSLGGASAVGGLAGCDGATDFDLADTDGGSGDQSVDTLALQSGVEIGMVFTGFGGQMRRSEVNPDEPGGGRLITVDDVEPDEQVTVDWRQTVERAVPPTETPNVGVGTPTPTPETEIVEETGTVTATGLADAHEPFLPMYWDPGPTKTDSSAMWLSREAFTELEETRQTAWSRDVLTRISWVGKEAVARIHSGVEEVEEVYLEAGAEYVDFELTVDGQPATVQAIEAHDTFGNKYVIVANAENPLVAKFTYDAVSTGFTGFDTGLWTLIKAVFSGYQVLAIDTP